MFNCVQCMNRGLIKMFVEKVSKALVISGLVLCNAALAAGPTCVTDTDTAKTYTITYSCGDGTVVSLPAAKTVTYGTTVSAQALGGTYCTPPSGNVYAGLEVLGSDGNVQATFYGTGALSFKYLYDRDIVVQPKYITGFSQDNMVAAADIVATSYSGNTSANTWNAKFFYGDVSGIDKCTSIVAQNANNDVYVGFVPDDQTGVTDSTEEGIYCYCKMTSPAFENTPWVLGGKYASASACRNDCAPRCSWILTTGGATSYRQILFSSMD